MSAATNQTPCNDTIIQMTVDIRGFLHVLTASGRIFWKSDRLGWVEIDSYPEGCAPGGRDGWEVDQ